jgi:hypothetical protein
LHGLKVSLLSRTFVITVNETDRFVTRNFVLSYPWIPLRHARLAG